VGRVENLTAESYAVRQVFADDHLMSQKIEHNIVQIVFRSPDRYRVSRQVGAVPCLSGAASIEVSGNILLRDTSVH
jgi:hypothetical protein